MNSKLGTLVYIDDTGDNKIVGIGQGVSMVLERSKLRNVLHVKLVTHRPVIRFIFQLRRLQRSKLLRH
jgi:hypothetical protein